MRGKGLGTSHIRDVPEFTAKGRELHVTDPQQLATEEPIDIAFVCMKSYDTQWATKLIAQYVSPNGFVMLLQNCMNGETIADVVGCIASSITVDLCETGHVHRTAGKSGEAPHPIPHRRSTRPHHQLRPEGPAPGRLRRFRPGHPNLLGRVLVEAGDQCHGQRHAPRSSVPERHCQHVRRGEGELAARTKSADPDILLVRYDGRSGQQCHHAATFDGCKVEQLWVTFGRPSGNSSVSC